MNWITMRFDVWYENGDDLVKNCNTWYESWCERDPCPSKRFLEKIFYFSRRKPSCLRIEYGMVKEKNEEIVKRMIEY